MFLLRDVRTLFSPCTCPPDHRNALQFYDFDPLRYSTHAKCIVCVHACTHTRAHTCVRTHTSVLDMWARVSIHARMQSFTHARNTRCLCEWVYHARTYGRVHTHAHASGCQHVRINTYTRVSTYRRTHIHAYTRVRA